MTNKEKKCKKYVGCIEIFPGFYAKTIFNEYGLKISPEEIGERALLVCPVDDGFFEYCKNVTEDDCIWVPYGADRYYPHIVIAVNSATDHIGCKRFFYTEEKADSRANRCILEDGKHCEGKSCFGCERNNTIQIFSLEQMKENSHFDLESVSGSPEDIVIGNMENEAFVEAASKLGEIERIIAEVFIQEGKVSDKRLMEKTGISKQSTLSYHKGKVLKMHEQEFGDWL